MPVKAAVYICNVTFFPPIFFVLLLGQIDV